MSELRDAGFCFSYGREWSPAEVFRPARERGVLDGSFHTIAWSGPGVFHVRDDLPPEAALAASPLAHGGKWGRQPSDLRARRRLHDDAPRALLLLKPRARPGS